MTETKLLLGIDRMELLLFRNWDEPKGAYWWHSTDIVQLAASFHLRHGDLLMLDIQGVQMDEVINANGVDELKAALNWLVPHHVASITVLGPSSADVSSHTIIIGEHGARIILPTRELFYEAVNVTYQSTSGVHKAWSQLLREHAGFGDDFELSGASEAYVLESLRNNGTPVVCGFDRIHQIRTNRQRIENPVSSHFRMKFTDLAMTSTVPATRRQPKEV